MQEKIEQIKKEYNEITAQMGKPGADYVKLAKQHKRLGQIIEKHEQYLATHRDIKAARELGLDDEAKISQEKLAIIEAELMAMLKPRDPRDDSNVIIEIRPAAGGDEAALFAASLFRMYSGFASMNGFRTELIDMNETDIGGIKEVSFMVVGDGAYSKLKYESGVHRVQRVPDTESSGRIHTSTCTVAVLPESVTVDFKIDDKNLRVDVYRASGAGGQHVNRTESAVRLTHLPTGLVVTCQDGRSQIKNRETAMRVLQSKLADFYQSQEDQKYASQRKAQVGTGERNERIRTYNFPQDRVTDHRIGFSLHNLPVFMQGEINSLIEALEKQESSQ